MPEAGLKHAGRIMAFDFGLARIGVAVGSAELGSAQGIATLRAKGGRILPDELGRLIDTWQPGRLLVGLPLPSATQSNLVARKARRFGLALAERFSLPLTWIDEHLTTRQADNFLIEATPPGKSLNRRRLKYRDQIAARLILQSYLARYDAASR